MGATKCARTPKQGFTMVELMVVIAIIGILIALLIGGVAGAIGMAENVQCQNNLTNIAKAVISYTTDYKGEIPPTMYAGQSGLYWCNFLVRGGYLSADNSATMPFDTPSAPNSVLRCPAENGLMVSVSESIDLPARQSGTDKAQGIARLGSAQFKVDCSYYWNGYTGNTSGQPETGSSAWTARFPSCCVDPTLTPDKKAQVVHDISEIRQRTQTAMVMDGVLFNAKDMSNRGRIAARHRGDVGDHGQTNVAFYDGHVEGIQRTPGQNWDYQEDSIQTSQNLETTASPIFLLPKR
jgi:prepilin-type N-terminal cleavage/methylation domain-containing protein/prepilin-type processing-associated H-X9-DG protein